MYLDVLWLVNLLLNYAMLLLTAKIFRRFPGVKRLFLGALLGALAVPVLLLRHYPAIPLAGTLIIPVIMVFIVFRPVRWLDLLFMWLTLFLVSFMAGGAVYALSTMLSRGEHGALGPGNLAGLLIMVCLALYLLLGILRPYLEEKKWQKLYRVNMSIVWRGKEKVVAAYLDTGNRLRDPFSQRPVIIINFRSLEGLLPSPVYQTLGDKDNEPWVALQDLEDDSQAGCFTLVPFNSLGEQGGMLLGFKPDAVTLSRGEMIWPVDSGVILGLSRRSFGPGAEYQALLPPDLLQAV